MNSLDCLKDIDPGEEINHKEHEETKEGTKLPFAVNSRPNTPQIIPRGRKLFWHESENLYNAVGMAGFGYFMISMQAYDYFLVARGFYCFRDDCVFDPKERLAFEISELNAHLFPISTNDPENLQP
ncbi:MAG: hypothetical protein ABFD44_03720 [Anaerolineaceae bacterium]